MGSAKGAPSTARPDSSLPLNQHYNNSTTTVLEFSDVEEILI
jgi:hypothetical protein